MQELVILGDNLISLSARKNLLFSTLTFADLDSSAIQEQE
jgi:hypothetical protein